MPKKKTILAADIETYTHNNDAGLQVHKPYKIGLFGKPVQIFTEKREIIDISQSLVIPEFLNHLKQRTKTEPSLYIYFHNFSSFDGVPLVAYLQHHCWSYTTIIRDNRIYEITLRFDKNRVVRLRDSYLHLNTSLDGAAQIFKLQDRKTFFNFENLSFSSLESKNVELNKYLRNDVQLLQQLIESYNDFLENLWHTNIVDSLTLSSLIQRIYIKDHYQPKFGSLNYLSGQMDDFIRQSYLGGIVDIYRPYLRKGVLLDVNSLYPYVMSQYQFGIGRLKMLSGSQLKGWTPETFCEQHLGFVEVLVECKKHYQPFIAIRHEDRIVQPYGKFPAVLYTEELRYSLKKYSQYYNYTMLKAAIYEKKEYLFKGFLESLYEKRKRLGSEDPQSRLIKQAMNSLYGRFGIRVEEDTTVVLNNLNELIDYVNNTEGIIKTTYEGPQYTVTSQPTVENKGLFLKKFKSRVDYAAATTALARIHMQRLKEQYNVYYMDTDSIVVSQADFKKLEKNGDIGQQMGKLKVEAEFDEGLFISPKLYALKLGQNITFKGLTIQDDFEKKTRWKEFKQYLGQNYNRPLTTQRRTQIISRIKQSNIIQRNNLVYAYQADYQKRAKIYQDEVWVNTSPPYVNIDPSGKGMAKWSQ